MFDYLIERQKEEDFRTSTRTLTFPNGESHRVEAYRLVWTWFDRFKAYEFGLSEEEILDHTLHCHEADDLPLGTALGRVVDYFVRDWEASGMDVTDDPLEMALARRGVQRFHERKRSR